MDEKDVMTDLDYQAYIERLSTPLCPTELTQEELEELQIEAR